MADASKVSATMSSGSRLRTSLLPRERVRRAASIVMELRKLATRSAPSSGSSRALEHGVLGCDADGTLAGLAVVAVTRGYADLANEVGLRYVAVAIESDQRTDADGDRVGSEG